MGQVALTGGYVHDVHSFFAYLLSNLPNFKLMHQRHRKQRVGVNNTNTWNVFREVFSTSKSHMKRRRRIERERKQKEITVIDPKIKKVIGRESVKLNENYFVRSLHLLTIKYEYSQENLLPKMHMNKDEQPLRVKIKNVFNVW